MNKDIKINETTATLRAIPLALLLTSGDPATGITVTLGELKISKGGTGAFANAAGVLSELDNGDYYYTPSAGEVDTLGTLRGRFIKTTIKTTRFAVEVVNDLSGAANLPYLGVIETGTAQTVGANSITLRAAAPFTNDDLKDAVVYAYSPTTLVWHMRYILSYDSVTKIALVDAWSSSITGSPVPYHIVGTPPAPTTADDAHNRAILDKLDGAMALNSGLYRFTAAALALGPSGTGSSPAQFLAAIDAAGSTLFNTILAKVTPLPASPAGIPNIPLSVDIAAALAARAVPELASTPGSAPTYEQLLAFVYMAIRNKRETTAFSDKICNNAGSAIGTASLTDAGGTFTKGKYA